MDGTHHDAQAVLILVLQQRLLYYYLHTDAAHLVAHVHPPNTTAIKAHAPAAAGKHPPHPLLAHVMSHGGCIVNASKGVPMHAENCHKTVTRSTQYAGLASMP